LGPHIKDVYSFYFTIWICQCPWAVTRCESMLRSGSTTYSWRDAPRKSNLFDLLAFLMRVIERESGGSSDRDLWRFTQFSGRCRGRRNSFGCAGRRRGSSRCRGRRRNDCRPQRHPFPPNCPRCLENWRSTCLLCLHFRNPLLPLLHFRCFTTFLGTFPTLLSFLPRQVHVERRSSGDVFNMRTFEDRGNFSRDGLRDLPRYCESRRLRE
jgi:hypothetical protein